MLQNENSWYEIGKLPDNLIFTNEMYKKLWNLRPDKPSKVKLFGKEFNTPRLHCCYGKTYLFNGSDNQIKTIPDIIKPILDWANNREKQLNRNTNFNQVLINWYRDGNDYIGWHSDNEKQIKLNSPIYTISLGITRKFKIKSNNKGDKFDFLLHNNTYFVMGGEFQKYYKHHIPKSKKIKESRISITLRNLV